ncbi:MAG: DUF2505 domain-containing protein [Demequinaceae bacterium]|nr:DUF2505 domain-containing protein [Demequinaceae bacterium]
MPEGKADLVADHAFDAPIERVAAMYANADFAHERGLAVGASECDAIVDGDAGTAFTVAIRRTMATDGLQPEFRPFLGSSVTVRYSEAWEPPGEGVREGTFAIDIVGVPARAAGTIRLAARGDSTELTLRGTVSVHMPFLAGLVTQAIIDSLAEAIEKELVAADAWLARA